MFLYCFIFIFNILHFYTDYFICRCINYLFFDLLYSQFDEDFLFILCSRNWLYFSLLQKNLKVSIIMNENNFEPENNLNQLKYYS